jgi:hypothetical protein
MLYAMYYTPIKRGMARKRDVTPQNNVSFEAQS